MHDPAPEPAAAGADDAAADPNLAIRRHTDRCFHRVEEVVAGSPTSGGGGFIVDGVLIPHDEVAEVRSTAAARDVAAPATPAPVQRCGGGSCRPPS